MRVLVKNCSNLTIFFNVCKKKLVKLPWVSLKWIPKECHYYQGPMLPMPSSLSNDDETSASDLNVLPGSKRKLREGFETSGLAKKLVFWSVIFFFHCFSYKYKNKVIWWFFLVLEKQLELCWNLFLLHRLECKTQSLPVWLHHL